VIAGIVVLATCLAYANSFSGVFAYDDRVTILENPTIRQLWPLDTVLQAPAAAGTGGRPFANLTFALSYALSGLQPWGHHVVNLFIHVLAALALFGVVRRTLVQPLLRDRFGPDATPLAGLVALLWAVHPLGTQTVTYLSQRTESLMALFYLLTLYGFIRSTEARPRLWQSLAVLACLLGTLSKEIIATAPLLVLLYDRTFVAGSFAGALRTRATFYAALASTWLVLAWLLFGVHARGVGYGLGVPWFDYALTQIQAVVLYLGLGLWPSPLIFDRGPGLLPSFADAAPSLLILILLLGATVWALVRRPAAGFLGACFFVILGPASSVIPVINQPIAENRPYLSLAALIAIVVLAGYMILRGRLTLVLGLVLAVACVVATSMRNRVYHSDLALWSDTATKAPESARAHYNLGLAYENAGRAADALFEYRRALQLNPFHLGARNNLANCLIHAGHAEAAIPHYEFVLRVQGDHPAARLNLAVVLTQYGRSDAAVPLLERAIRDTPDSALAHDTLGQALTALDRAETALPHFTRALTLQPTRAITWNFTGVALAKLKRIPEARAHFARAAQLDPAYAEPHNNLGDILLQLGQAEASLAEFQRALELNPALFEARQNLGNAYARLDRFADAAPHFAAAVQLRPDNAEARNNLGCTFARLGRIPEAIAELETAVRLNPGYAEARQNLAAARTLASPGSR
jgi:tetratricopeptide (TPR) repeat protein